MSEEEIMQNENNQQENCEQNCEQKCEKECCTNGFSTVGYDICGLILCIYPILTTIFAIDYHDANEIVQTGLKMLLFCAIPFAIAKIGLKKSNVTKSLSSLLFSVIFVLIVVYAVILLIGIADGGQLF